MYRVVFSVNVWADSEDKAQDLAEKMVAAREYSDISIEELEPPDPPGWEGGFAENH